MIKNVLSRYIWEDKYLVAFNNHPVVSELPFTYFKKEYLRYVGYIRANHDRFQKEYNFVVNNIDKGNQLWNYVHCVATPSKVGRYYTNKDFKHLMGIFNFMYRLKTIVEQDKKLQDINNMCKV